MPRDKDPNVQSLRLDPKTTLIPLTVLIAAIPVIFWAGAAWTGQGSAEKERIVVLETEAEARGETLEELKVEVAGAGEQLVKVREELAGLRAEIRSLQVVHPGDGRLLASRALPRPAGAGLLAPEHIAPIGSWLTQPGPYLCLPPAGDSSDSDESR